MAPWTDNYMAMDTKALKVQLEEGASSNLFSVDVATTTIHFFDEWILLPAMI
jgi:hypothetical protein